MQTRELMVTPPIVIRDDASLREAAELMLEKSIGGLPVVDQDGTLVGMVTESDFTLKEKGIPFSIFRAPSLFNRWVDPRHIENAYRAAAAIAVREIMTEHVLTAGEETPIQDVLRMMLEHDLHRMPVVRNGKVIGVIARHDLLHLMASGSETGQKVRS